LGTSAAISKFQKIHGLDVTGQLDARTVDALRE
jgi:peptidoglycan hydrolase-like protein with peptidoglycan-binding domain